MASNRVRQILACLVVAVAMSPSLLVAAPTAYRIRGTIVSTTSEAALQSLGLAIGDSFSIDFTVDPDLAIDTNPTSYTGAYSFPASPLVVTVAGHTATSSGMFVLVGDNAATDPPVDFVSVYGLEPYSSTFPAPHQVVGLTIGLTTSDVTTISGDGFIIPTDFGRFDENRTLSISLRNTTDSSEVIVVGLIAETTPSPAHQITELMTRINTLHVAFGTATSLNAKLGAASQALAHGHEDAACASIGAVIKESLAQSGKKLTPAQSAAIVNDATLVLSSLDCRQ